MSTALFDSIKTQAKITDSVIVGFSSGKDSIVTLDLCFKYFKHVVPYFMYIVPNLSFQERTLQKYERHYNTEILRIPHFEMSDFMRYGTFRNPDPMVRIVSVAEEYDYLRLKTGIDWIAAGERIADSIVRRAMIKKSGSIDQQRGRFFPLAQWNKRDVLTYIKRNRLYMPPDSRELGFSFRSLAGAELAVIKKTFPDDYQQILKYYPLADVAVERFNRYGE